MNTPTDDGGQAFPCPVEFDPGMSLRDWFAGQALIGMLSSTFLKVNNMNPDQRAHHAYQYADSMLAARKQK